MLSLNGSSSWLMIICSGTGVESGTTGYSESITSVITTESIITSSVRLIPVVEEMVIWE